MRIKLTILFFFFPLLAFAVSPTKVGTDTNYSPSGTGNQTFNHTVPSTGENKCIFVFSDGSSTNQPSAMNVNGSSMTLLAQNTPVTTSELRIWWIAATTTGAHVIASTATGNSAYLAITFQDCHQTVQGEASQAGGSDAGGTSLQRVITQPATDSLTVLHVNLTDNPDDATSITHGTGQSELSTKFQHHANWNGTTDVVTSQEVGEDVMDLSWTGTNKFESLATAIAYQAPAAGAPPPQRPFFWFWLGKAQQFFVLFKNLISTAYASAYF